MRRVFIIAVAAGTLIAGCTSNGDNTDGGTSTGPAAASTTVQSTDGAPFEVESLGLTFRLPETFGSVDDPDYAFLARSMSPRSIFTISEDSPGITQHVAEPGEALSDLDLGVDDAVVVTDAVLEGIPPGVSANELLVSNGDGSFSVIMSAATADLSRLWDVFIASVSVTPAD